MQIHVWSDSSFRLFLGGRDMKALFLFTGSRRSGAVTGNFSARKENPIWCTPVPKHLSLKCSSWKPTRQKKNECVRGFVYRIYLCVHAVFLCKCLCVPVWGNACNNVWNVWVCLTKCAFMILCLSTIYMQSGLKQALRLWPLYCFWNFGGLNKLRRISHSPLTEKFHMVGFEE